MRPIRVLLVDDHSLFRSGIRLLLQRQPGFEVVGEAADGLEGIKRAKSLQPDVVLLDLHMPGISGREAVRAITEEAPDAQVLMLTVSEEAEDLVDTLRNGARGYMLKNSDIADLTEAIRRAARGEAVMSPQLTAKLVSGLQSLGREAQAAPPNETDALSPREKEILSLLARGASNKEMARDLGVSESTVKMHLRHILKKLNLSSRVQAAVYAVEHGLGNP
jgi:two-component system nitrate/nitrite response regulator NarL